jgi:hypothetical protein
MLASNARRTRPQSRLVAGALLLATVGLSASGCTLVTDADRSKIPADSPPPSSTADAGEGPPPDSGSPGEPPPGEIPDAGGEDAATVPVDGGPPALDAGDAS